VYYSSSQADALSSLAQQGSAADSHQQLNVHSTLVTSDDRQGELFDLIVSTVNVSSKH